MRHITTICQRCARKETKGLGVKVNICGCEPYTLTIFLDVNRSCLPPPGLCVIENEKSLMQAVLNLSSLPILMMQSQ